MAASQKARGHSTQVYRFSTTFKNVYKQDEIQSKGKRSKELEQIIPNNRAPKQRKHDEKKSRLDGDGEKQFARANKVTVKTQKTTDESTPQLSLNQVQNAKLLQMVQDIRKVNSQEEKEQAITDLTREMKKQKHQLELTHSDAIQLLLHIAILGKDTQSQIIPDVAQLLYNGTLGHSYYEIKSLIAQCVVNMKLTSHTVLSQCFDKILSECLVRNISKVQNDYLHLLHTLILIMKEPKGSDYAFNFLKTFDIVLTQLSKLDVNKYKEGFQNNRDIRDELERISQFLGLVSHNVAMNSRFQDLHVKALINVFQVIESVNLNRQNARSLSFLASCFGRNCIDSPILDQIRTLIFDLVMQGKATNYDLVEILGYLLNVGKLTSKDIKDAKLDQYTVFAHNLTMKDHKLSMQSFRFFEILAFAQIKDEPVWKLYFNKLPEIDFRSLSFLDLKQTLQTLSFIVEADGLEKFKVLAGELLLKVISQLQFLNSKQPKIENSKISTNEARIVAILTSLYGQQFQVQQQLLNERFTVDFLNPETKTIINVDGPTHFIREYKDGKLYDTGRFNGRTQVRVDVLKREGYKMISLSIKDLDLNDDDLKALIQQNVNQ